MRISWSNATFDFILSIFEKFQIRAIFRLKNIVINISLFCENNSNPINNFWIYSLRIKNKLYFSSNFYQEFSIIDNFSISFQLRYSFKIELSKSLVFMKLIFWAFRLYIVFIRIKSRKETYNCLKILNLRNKRIVKTSFIIYNRNVQIINNFKKTWNIASSRNSIKQSITINKQTLVLLDYLNWLE